MARSTSTPLTFHPYCEEIHLRPRISHKVLDYLEKRLVERVLEPYRIWVGTGWNHQLHLMFDSEYNAEPIVVLPPNVYKKDKIKAYTAMVGLQGINTSVNPNQAYAERVLEVVKVLLTEYSNRISPAQFEAVEMNLDQTLLDSLPFPAPFAEQRYVQDGDPTHKAIYLERFGT